MRKRLTNWCDSYEVSGRPHDALPVQPTGDAVPQRSALASAQLRPAALHRESPRRWNRQPALTHDRTDFFGNPVTYFAVQEPHDTLIVTASSTVELATAGPPPDFDASLPWDTMTLRLAQSLSPEVIEARHLVLDSPMVLTSADLVAFAQPSFSAGRPLLDAVHDLSQRIHREFIYDPHFSTIATPLSRRADAPPRRVPGLRTPGDRLPAVARPAGPLRQRLPADASRRRGSPASSAPTHRTPGSPSSTPTPVGSTSIRPTTRSSATSTSRRRGAATTPTSRRSRASSSAGGAHTLEVAVDMEEEK